MLHCCQNVSSFAYFISFVARTFKYPCNAPVLLVNFLLACCLCQYVWCFSIVVLFGNVITDATLPR